MANSRSCSLIVAACVSISFPLSTTAKQQIQTNPPPLIPWNGDYRDSLYDLANNCTVWTQAKPTDCYRQGAVVDPTTAQKNFGYSVFFESGKDQKDLLLIPKDRISGIEANEPNYEGGKAQMYIPDYWQAAVSIAKEFSKAGVKPEQLFSTNNKEWLVVAVNSASTRHKDQLHFHICTLSSTVGNLIYQGAGGTADQWGKGFNINPKQHWEVMRLGTKSVGKNPFQLVFEGGADYHNIGGLSILLAIDPLTNDTRYLVYNQVDDNPPNEGTAAESITMHPCARP